VKIQREEGSQKQVQESKEKDNVILSVANWFHQQFEFNLAFQLSLESELFQSKGIDMSHSSFLSFQLTIESIRHRAVSCIPSSIHQFQTMPTYHQISKAGLGTDFDE